VICCANLLKQNLFCVIVCANLVEKQETHNKLHFYTMKHKIINLFRSGSIQTLRKSSTGPAQNNSQT